MTRLEPDSKPGVLDRFRERVDFTRSLPFGIAALSAASLFAGTVAARAVLPRDVFGEFSLFVTVAALCSGFGAMGLEQVVLRTSRVGPQRSSTWVVLDRVPFMFALLAAVFTATGVAVYWQSAAQTVSPVWVWVSAFSVTICMVVGNVLRLGRRWTASQMSLVGWRIWLVLALVVSAVAGRAEQALTFAIIVVALANAITLAISLFRSWHVRLRVFRSSWISFGLAFLASMGIITALGQGDRILAERTLGTASLGDYLFCWTLLGGPYMVVTSYVGFKELVTFKAVLSHPRLGERIVRVVGVCALAYLATSVLTLRVIWGVGLAALWPADTSRWVAVPFGLIVLMRAGYTILSSFLGARGSAGQLMFVNWITVAGMAAASVAVLLSPSIATIAWAAFGAWTTRAWASWWVVKYREPN